MGQQVITPPPETDRDTTTQPDEPGPGTRGAYRRDREHREHEARQSSRTGWLAAAVVAIVALAAGAFALSSSSDQTTVSALSNVDEAAAIQGEKQLVASGRQVDDPAGLTVQDDIATLQAEKDLALTAAAAPDPVRDDSAWLRAEQGLAVGAEAPLAPVGDDSGTLQAEKEATRSRSLVNDGVEADVADDAETLAQEKAAAADGDDALANEKASILSGRDQVEPAPSNDDLVLQGEKEAALDRGVIAAAPPPDVAGSDQRFHNQAAVLAAGPDVASQQDEAASLQDEKEHAQADRSVVEPAVDEAETLQQEKEHAQANRGGESSSVVDDSVALQGEKEQRLDRTQPGETGSSQVDDGARAAREKAAAAPVVQRQPRPGDPVLPPPRF